MTNSFDTRHRSGRLAAGLICLGAALGIPGNGAAAGEPGLPLARANAIASAAVAACKADGYAVSAAVVDSHGELVAFQKGDGSTPHTRNSSQRKAYTVVTLGPIFGFDRLGTFVARVTGKPDAEAIATLPDILLLAGGMAITDRGRLVGAVGVGGAPGGEKDESCAIRALDAAPAAN